METYRQENAFTQLEEKSNCTLTESTQSEKYLGYLSKYYFIFEANLENESEDEVVSNDEENQSKIIMQEGFF